MEILVCVKQVPDTVQVKIDPETGVLCREGVESKLNPYDLYAVELALSLRERYGGRVRTLSMGPAQAARALQETVYMGVDGALLISDRAFAGSDVLATAYALSQAVKKAGRVDLLICGKQTTDGDTAQVGVELAEFLGMPHTTHVTEVETITAEGVTVGISTEEKNRRERLPMPCLICVGDGINTPRLPSYRRKKECGERRLQQIPFEEFQDRDPAHYGLDASPTRVVRVFEPEKNMEKHMTCESPRRTAELLLQLFREERLIREETR